MMTKEILFRGKKIIYNISGKGDCLVLLHGFMESKEVWSEFIKEIKSELCFICPDFPGHGESEVLDETPTMEVLSELINEILKTENIDSFVVCGHSMGGYVALQICQMFPEKAKGIILFHSHASADSEETKENRRRTINVVNANRQGFISQFIPDLFDKKHVDKYSAQIEVLVESAKNMSKQAITGALEAMRERKDALNFLLMSEIPILFVIGKQDTRMPYNQLFAQAMLPSQSEMLLLEDVGHMGHIEAKETTAKAVEHFVLRCL